MFSSLFPSNINIRSLWIELYLRFSWNADYHAIQMLVEVDLAGHPGASFLVVMQAV